ncbi:solute carrier family 2, facilitated glucose transporter member 2 isoform X2 [Wyeomyia smithii]|uniref:solute carrier family 2, facilitated glucose transporter member 2 isoform X2 n=1 Tax=Wyeomyia smithii TaxID=174621 RepID=UPI0024682044|nr:solute carrier family 2, facilitated glucose transporter member 2 isoform X2 [Wyeomyia smithii]
MFGLLRQLCAISGLLLTFCGGIHIGWSIFHLYIAGNKWAVGITVDEYRFAILSFFTGVGFILLLLTFCKDLVSTRVWLIVSSFFFLINGIFFTAMPTYYAATVATRIIAGFGHGIAHLVMTIYIGEIAYKKFRGKLITLIPASMVAGVTVFSIISMVTTNPVYIIEPAMQPNRALGIIIMPLSCGAIVLSFFYTADSPIFILLTRKDEPASLNSIKLFRDQTSETSIVKQEFDEIKLLVSESDVLSKMFITEGNFKPFQLVLMIKLANLLFFNYSMNLAKMAYMSFMFTLTLTSHNWAPPILMLSKLIAVCIAIFSVDILPRRFQYAISSIFTGSFLLAFGIVLATHEYLQPWIAPFLYITAEVFNALGMLPISEILLSEVFPPKKKVFSIINILICEYVGHMIVYIIYFNVPSNPQSTYIKIIVFGGVILLKCLIGVLVIPDTRNTTLREAVNLFFKH